MPPAQIRREAVNSAQIRRETVNPPTGLPRGLFSTTALDRRTLMFGDSPHRAATEDHQPTGPAPPSSMQHRISRFDLLHRASSLRFVFTPWTPRRDIRTIDARLARRAP